MSELRISGIYDKKCFAWAKSNGFTQFQFSLIPTSLNFVQFYKIQEILGEGASGNFSFLFQNESEGSINYFLQQIAGVLKKEQAQLAFADQKEKSYYNQFSYAFSIEIDNLEGLKKLVDSEFLNEVILPYSSLEFLHGRGEVQDFLKSIFQYKQKHDFSVGIKLPWDFDKISSIFDFYSFDFFQLAINSNVEESYRNFSEFKANRGLKGISFLLKDHL